MYIALNTFRVLFFVWTMNQINYFASKSFKVDIRYFPNNLSTNNSLLQVKNAI